MVLSPPSIPFAFLSLWRLALYLALKIHLGIAGPALCVIRGFERTTDDLHGGTSSALFQL